MFRDSQNATVFFYIFCLEVMIINSKTTLWKLNSDKTKIIGANPFQPVVSSPVGTSNRIDGYLQDEYDNSLFDIITSTEHFGQSWVKKIHTFLFVRNNSTQKNMAAHNLKIKEKDDILDCGKPVNFTYYDNLVGVLNRNRHPNVPEPQAILYFNKNYGKTKNELDEFDIDILEAKAKKGKKEKIKGDAGRAIECFRRALAISPHNAEALLQYLDDAIYLTRRSLEVQPPDKGAWQQYFTLGEIF
ncbi:hypothetical protein NQ317_014234 [Molorchus minor]|uniref:Uncharacterized protein n=1 Tax=Molorchus minor TaxID=1323400 RepID=A0ABQ9J0F3_9CUCU|nr:hypothetical protein NQ317_014234 [Molorchus minor]